MQTKKSWSLVKEKLKETNDKTIYNTWFKSLDIVNEDKNTIYLLAPSSFNKNIIINKKYPLLIQEIYYEITGISKNFAILCEEDLSKDMIEYEVLDEKYINNSNLNEKYVFDEFVVGANNRFAHAACVAVAQSPGKSYNPLFLYGGVGLGKTHLMQAIGHYVLKNNNNANVLYITSEKFTNDFINSIKTSKSKEFREFYRNNVDVLLIDDIQFLSDKERTQEEFFHTFNDLYQSNKQIVISSDRQPREIKTLEERLSSRFEWGLITDINSPDYETRVAILRKKAESENKNIESSVFEFIAKNIKSNIRELEGAFTRVVAYSALTGDEINEKLCKEALKEILEKNQPRAIDSDFIREVVCNYFQVTELEIDSPRRTKAIVYARQIAMYLIRKYTDLSFPDIGNIFGGRDHSTVIYAYEKINTENSINGSTSEDINNIISKLNSNE